MIIVDIYNHIAGICETPEEMFPGRPYMEADELPEGEGTLMVDVEQRRIWWEPVPKSQEPEAPTADRDYDPGEYMTVDGTMYRVLLPILAGSRITIGTNVEATTIEAEMANLNKEES